MKTLQNNFTTQEQSRRLWELGVPSDSADCCLRRVLTDGGYCETWTVDVFDFIGHVHDDYLPCWSVGRLMEIFDVCCILKDGTEWMNTQSVPESYVSYIIDCYVCAIKHKQLDFSKLEE